MPLRIRKKIQSLLHAQTIRSRPILTRDPGFAAALRAGAIAPASRSLRSAGVRFRRIILKPGIDIGTMARFGMVASWRG